MTKDEAMRIALEALVNNRYIIESEINLPEALEEVDVAITALRQALAQDHGFDRTASHMAGEYVDTNWDTSDMAHRTGGLSVEECIDRGAWSDVPDATKWVDELRGDDDTEQEPVAWMYVNKDGEVGDIGYGVPTVKDPYIKLLYEAPPSKPWVSLTDEEIRDIHWSKPMDEYSFARAIEAALKEKNT